MLIGNYILNIVPSAQTSIRSYIRHSIFIPSCPRNFFQQDETTASHRLWAINCLFLRLLIHHFHPQTYFCTDIRDEILQNISSQWTSQLAFIWKSPSFHPVIPISGGISGWKQRDTSTSFFNKKCSLLWTLLVVFLKISPWSHVMPVPAPHKNNSAEARFLPSSVGYCYT